MDEIPKIMDLVLKEANSRENAAAHNGERSDGGATTLRQQVYFYQMGLQGRVPKEWEKYRQQLDPEYQEYLRLKRKFDK